MSTESTAGLTEMQLQLKGYGLTTAEIIYHKPDHEWFLQTYFWQEYDLAPHFPGLKGFLKHWQEKLDGPLHTVRFVHRPLISASEWRMVKEIAFH